MKRTLLLGVTVFVLGGCLFLATVYEQWQQPLNIPAAGHRVVIAQGESLRTVVSRLHREGILQQPRLSLAYGRWTGLDAQIKPGEYLVSAGTRVPALLLQLRSGKVIQYQVTFPEGITLHQTLQIMGAQEPLEQLVNGPADERIRDLGKNYSGPEGLFFPDTYLYQRGESDWQLLRRANAAMLEVLQREWDQRAPDLPYETPYEALIMASIIEKETGLAEEREAIAGVFVRRLQKNMRLQTDPTIIYGLGPQFDGNLRRKHLNDSANIYNTYRHHGLPPTPIALPGRAAIYAALHPAAGDSLYFVARGDGGHKFSATLEEHERAVRKYQLQRKSNYRSSPRN